MSKTNGRPLKTQTDLDRELLAQPDLCEGFERGELSKNRKIRHIKWGLEFKSWSMRKQLKRAMDLASTINDALDIMQKERNKLLGLCTKQETHVKKLLAERSQSSEVLLAHITRANAAAQSRVGEIQELKAQARAQAKRIEDLGGGNHC